MIGSFVIHSGFDWPNLTYFVFSLRHPVIYCMLTSVMVMFSVPGCVHGQTPLHFSQFVRAFAFQLAEVEVDCCVVKLPKNVIPERGLVL